MKTNFFLRVSSSKLYINFEYRDGSNLRYRISTGFQISRESDWDNNRQRLKLPSSTFNASLINSKLNEFEVAINNHLLRNDNHIDLEDVKRLFLDVFQTKQEKRIKQVADSNQNQKNLTKDKLNSLNKRNKSFLAYYEWFLDFYSKNNSVYTKKVLAAGTIKSMNTVLSVLRRYIKHKGIQDLNFDDINKEFYYDFMTYLLESNYSKNYIGTVIQKIKTVMSYSHDDKKHKNVEFKNKYFTRISEEVNHPYLNLDELNQIEKLNLPDRKMDLARDIFLIGCYTGLRIGDLLKFIKNPNFIEKDGVKFFQVKQSKTTKTVYIPLKSKILKIMEKYGGNLPDYLHHNAINKNLKSICKRAGINEMYQYSRTEGGEEVIHKEPKYKFISTHTARRSFCTNAYYSDMPVFDIMTITGHKSERVFLNYIKVSELQKASRISYHPFFD